MGEDSLSPNFILSLGSTMISQEVFFCLVYPSHTEIKQCRQHNETGVIDVRKGF